MVCLLISIFVWFTVKMDNEYKQIVPIPLKFVNPPKSRVLSEASDSVIYVELSEKGSELLRYRYFNARLPLIVSTRNVILAQKDSRSFGYILTNSLSDDIGYQHDLAGKVVSISPDTIFLVYKKETVKKVPVTALLEIETQKQYMIYGKVAFQPDSVMVRGPEDVLAGISSADLGTIKLKDIDQLTRLELPVRYESQHKSVTFTPDVVNVSIPVEKFTEAKVEVPVTVVADSSLKVKLFPENVTVSYRVALKDYSQVTAGMFLPVADFRHIDIEKEKKVRVKVDDPSPTIKVTRTEPDRVEFILIK